ncbi:hypothetical protein J2Z44_000874 [Clostridium punense]|uniref:Transmembrane protein n=1 Tax=Clostridium punense TaxID=1054297 RepID=A0ABS4JZX4_9CLOT|nr:MULTISPECIES: hypothetical protein [Clostridium]EQB89310.1 hypothetical protein M918_20920 [Clostridium sp. BL8]MBP2021087.1 hypothetical protein [Clostridium punense]
MDIDKVLRKQKKSYKRFMLSMGFIFVLLPIVLQLSGNFNMFFIFYLVLIETLIIFSMVIRHNEEYLVYKLEGTRLTIIVGARKRRYNISTEKVAIVHTIKNEKIFDLMIVTKSRFRNKRLGHLDFRVLEKYPEVEKVYNKVKMPEEGPYFFFIIRKGGMRKYLLLNLLYKYSSNAIFTESAVERIKETRN